MRTRGEPKPPLQHWFYCKNPGISLSPSSEVNDELIAVCSGQDLSTLAHHLGYLEPVAAAPALLTHGHWHLRPAEPHRLGGKTAQTDPNSLGAGRGVLGRGERGQLEVWPCRATNRQMALSRNQSSQYSLDWCRCLCSSQDCHLVKSGAPLSTPWAGWVLGAPRGGGSS